MHRQVSDSSDHFSDWGISLLLPGPFRETFLNDYADTLNHCAYRTLTDRTTVCKGFQCHSTYLMPTGTPSRLVLPVSSDPVCYNPNTLASLIPIFHLHRTPPAGTVILLPSSVAHLVQLPQQDLSEVKGGEADPHRDGAFDPVHTKTFIESTDHPFLCDNLPHGAQDGAVRVTRHPSSLHSAPYHIQRVGRRLANETGASSKDQAFVRVRLQTAAVLYGKEEKHCFKICFWFGVVGKVIHLGSVKAIPACTFFSVSYVKKLRPA